MSALLTYPEDHWCPRCQVHLRSQDAFTGPHIFKPLCPVCADDDRRILNALDGGYPAPRPATQGATQ